MKFWTREKKTSHYTVFSTYEPWYNIVLMGKCEVCTYEHGEIGRYVHTHVHKRYIHRNMNNPHTIMYIHEGYICTNVRERYIQNWEVYMYICI